MADEEGYVNYPNVNPIFEAADAQEAKHAYKANLNMMKSTKEMALDTLEILK
jgi:flagellar basal-body rod protein FlgC